MVRWGFGHVPTILHFLMNETALPTWQTCYPGSQCSPKRYISLPSGWSALEGKQMLLVYSKHITYLFLYIAMIHFQADCLNQFYILHRLKGPSDTIFQHCHCLKEMGTEEKYTYRPPGIQSSFNASSFKSWLCLTTLFHSTFLIGYLCYLIDLKYIELLFPQQQSDDGSRKDDFHSRTPLMLSLLFTCIFPPVSRQTIFIHTSINLFYFDSPAFSATCQPASMRKAQNQYC